MTLALILAISQQTVQYALAKDASYAYDVRQTFKTLDGNEETTTVEIWTFTVAESLAGGAAMLRTEKVTTAMEVDGRHIEIRAVPHRGTEKRSPRGAVRDREPTSQIEPAFELRLLRIADLEYPASPINATAEWAHETKPTDDGLPAATRTYRATQIKDGKLSGTFTFEEKGVESPIQAEGKFTTSLKDGWPVEISLKAVNTHQLGDEEKLPTVYSFSMKRR